MIQSLIAPIHVPLANAWLRMYKSQRIRTTTRLRGEVAALLSELHVPAALGPSANVLLTRYSDGKPDDDGVVGSLKCVRDQVAHWLGVNDGSALVAWRYRAERCERGRFGIRIDIDDGLGGPAGHQVSHGLGKKIDLRPKAGGKPDRRSGLGG